MNTPQGARVWAALAGAAASAGALAQPEAVQRLERQLREFDATYRVSIPSDQPIAERVFVDAGGSFRFGFYSIDDALSNGHVLRQYDGRVYARVELDGAHRFFGRLRFQWDDWNDGDSFDGEGDDLNDPVVERLFYQFDLRGLERARTGVAPDYNFNIKGGKQFVFWNSGLVLSAVMWAGVADVEIGKLAITGIGGITSSQDTIDFDGSRPDFDDHTDRIFAGGQIEWRGPEHQPFGYFLTQIDDNKRNFATIGGLFPTQFGYDSQYLGFGSKGPITPNWNYRVEFVKEFGRTFSNSFDPVGGGPVAQTRDDIDAYAGIFGATYLFRDSGDTRFDLEVIGGSGDDDRLDSSDTFGGNAPGTKDRSFNALGFANTGLALVPQPANLLSLRLGLSSAPWGGKPGIFQELRLGIEGLIFNKIDDNAPISTVTLPGKRFVGGEIDLSADWRITSDVTLQAKYGVFFAGDAMPSAIDEPRQFLYLGATYAF